MMSSQICSERRSDELGEPAVLGGPILKFDSISVSDEVVAVAGSVREALALVSDLGINGQRVPIDDRGKFFAVVRLEGYDGLSLWLDAGIHGDFALDVPLKAS
jgi:hypothetical protein